MASAPGRPSALHPRLGMTWKRAKKIEVIARLSLDPANYTNEQIANHLGCNKQTVVLIRQLPAYHAKMIELQTNLTSPYDLDIRTNSENMRDELKSMIPSSMMVIRNALTGKHGPALQYKAALEVFDREGTMAKVSKSSVTVEQKPNMQVDPQVQQNLLSLLASAPVNTPIADITIASGSSSSAFTTSAAGAVAIVKGMSESNTEKTLEALVQVDLSNQKPN